MKDILREEILKDYQHVNKERVSDVKQVLQDLKNKLLENTKTDTHILPTIKGIKNG